MKPSRAAHPYWMLAPTLILLTLFVFLPLAFAVRMSFFEWDLLTPPRFVGFENYAAVLESGEFLGALGRTLSFSVLVVTGSLALGLGLALLLDRPGPLAAFVRSAIFSAYVVSWVSVGLLFLWLFDRDAGLVNAALRALGLAPLGFLGDPQLALVTLASVSVWKITGYALVLFLAGLKDVPEDVLEAAALDGAGPVRRFIHVSWPLLAPTTAFVATTSLITSFQVFDVVRVMTQGGPVRSTTLLVYAIFEQIFLNLRVGRASALSVGFFLVLLALTSIQLWAHRRRGAA
jgi:sn-glycerol 3-phosphate transport system permease protein